MGKRLTNISAAGMHVTVDNTDELRRQLLALVTLETLVGVPNENTERDDPASQDVTNATLAYIHDNGAPRIPARPFMLPGMENAKDEVTNVLAKTAQYALYNNGAKVLEGFERVGMIASKEIRNVIRAGIAPPLAPRTLRARAAKGRKGAAEELRRRAKGLAPELALATPLMDTNEMLKSITYVVRKRSARR